MKKFVIAAAIATAAFFIPSPDANAGGFQISIGTGGSCGNSSFGRSGHSHSSGYSNYRSGSSYRSGSNYNSYRSERSYGNRGYSQQNCQPYIVRTIELSRRCQSVVSHYLPCGTPVYRHVTVVTYQSMYSNGSCRTYNQTFY